MAMLSTFPRRGRTRNRCKTWLARIAAMAVVGVVMGAAGATVGSTRQVTGHRADIEARTPRVDSQSDSGANTVVPLAVQTTSATEAVEPFEAIGLTWSGPAASASLRYRSNGTWSDWKSVDVDSPDAADAPTDMQKAETIATEMTWVGSADQYQVRYPTTATAVKVQLVRDRVETSTVTGPQPAGAAPAEPGGPPIHSRAEWGARAGTQAPEYGTKVQVVFVHHTVNSNNYGPGDVPAMVRAIQAYHMDANGWSDIGYNFLVDRYGGIWEGRAGGTDQPVIGAQTGGLNTDSTGIAVIGDFTSTAPTEASVNSVAQVAGWKLSLGSMNPFGTSVLTSRGNPDNLKYPPGSQGVFNNISGHRDGWFTECPGNYLYNRLPDIRARAAAWYPNVPGSVDSTQRIPAGVRVSGWALDVNTTDPINVAAYVDGNGTSGFTGVANLYRGDVGAAMPAYGPLHGFAMDVAVGPGQHQICVYGINDTGGFNPTIGCIVVNVDPDPIGSLDLVRRVPGGVRVAGWALDPDTPDLIAAHIYSNGAFRAAVGTGGSRPDVAVNLPDYGTNHGFDTVVAIPPGLQQICGYGINVGPGNNAGFGCRSLAVNVDPFGSLDAVTGGAGSLSVAGWAIDPDSAAPIGVHVYVDGAFASVGIANLQRTDVGAAFPDYGPTHAFYLVLPASPGTHQVCAYGLNVASGSNGVLGCRTATVS